MYYTHDQHTAKALGIVALTCIIIITLVGCSPKQYSGHQAPHQTDTEYQKEITLEMEAMDKDQASKDNPQPANFTGIAEALGCMFDPAGCEKKKEAQAQEREMNR